MASLHVAVTCGVPEACVDQLVEAFQSGSPTIDKWLVCGTDAHALGALDKIWGDSGNVEVIPVMLPELDESLIPSIFDILEAEGIHHLECIFLSCGLRTSRPTAIDMVIHIDCADLKAEEIIRNLRHVFAERGAS